MKKPIVLVFVGHYLPGFRVGGPLRSIANLVDHLHPEFDFRILTSDRDLGDEKPYPGVPTDRWVPVGKALVRYVPPAEQSVPALARIIRETEHDIVYLNSFFSPRFTIVPLIARRLKLLPKKPMIIAPRGEFSQGALAIKSAKKKAYMAVSRMARLLSDAIWQASSEWEAADIRRAVGNADKDIYIATALARRVSNIHIAVDLFSPLGAQVPVFKDRVAGEPLRVLFLGRISPMKNLDYALRVLAMVQTPVTFSIVGPTEDAAYLAECKQLEAALPDNITVEWRGPVDPANVPVVMGQHDLFFLPTRGENFGHVISEALGAGTPVLLSDTTPWRGMVEAGIGYDLPLADPTAFAAAIEAAAQERREDATARRTQAYAYARERQIGSADLEANRQLFYTALDRAQLEPIPKKEINL